jgi:hypothetical protein
MEHPHSLYRWSILIMENKAKIMTGVKQQHSWILGTLLLLIGTLLPAQADPQNQSSASNTGQYYLIAYQNVEGSIAATSQDQNVVYLRWDALEGRLPDDAVMLRLTRDGVTLLERETGDIMTVAQIDALYQGATQQRRLLETLKSLKQQAVASGQDFALNDFAAQIRQRIDRSNPGTFNALWSYLASRNDINIARARYRAFIDRPGNGVFDYELLAIDASGASARLGLVRIDTSQPQALLGAQSFKQVEQGQCDLPELGKDHYTVALSWQAPGATNNPTDQFAAQIYISGYDLYRSSANLSALQTTAPLRNIATEAAQASFDNNGVAQMAGLEKVNDVLLTVNSDGDNGAEWIETRDQLQAAGLQPGDRRAYYLVARDFTGNYGPTQATIVSVANKIRPPAPWELRDFIDQSGVLNTTSSPALMLSWDKVNVANYINAYRSSRQFCNEAEAASTGTLKFVARGEDCQIDAQRSVHLDVASYKVYRFDNFEQAQSFKDSDGDGVGDAIERALAAGTQCDALIKPADTSLNREIGATLSEITLPDSAQQVIRMQDKTPADTANLDNVFWYRVASVASDGRLSLLSAPQRGLVPDRELPPKPVVKVTRPAKVADGGCEVVVDSPTGPWFFDEQVDDKSFQIACENKTIFNNVFDNQVKTSSSKLCGEIRQRCGTNKGAPVTLTYSAPGKGIASCVVRISTDLGVENEDFEFCNQGQGRLVPTYREEQVEVTPGEVVSDGLIITIEEPASDTCVSLFEIIDGVDTRVKTSCNDPSNPDLITYPVDSGFFCGYAIAQDGNNNVSAVQMLPCFSVLLDNNLPLSSPQPVALIVQDDKADFRWRLPTGPVASVLVKLQQKSGDGNGQRDILSFAVAGESFGQVMSGDAPIPPLGSDSDEWCVSFRAIAIHAEGSQSRTSAWSTPHCITRSNNTSTDSFLPWPSVSGAASGRALKAQLHEFVVDPNTQQLQQLLAIDIAPLSASQLDLLDNHCTLSQQDLQQHFQIVECSPLGKTIALSQLAEVNNFLVYRQSRRNGIVSDEWIQVSPLIDYIHWDVNVRPNPKTPTFTRILNDPYIKLRQTGGGATSFSFIDQYPYFTGVDYRYQIIYFAPDQRIVNRRQSDWVSVEAVQ